MTAALEGIGIHADEAAVNVNFWITPDEANLDPEGGGLVIWDKAAPLEWDFAKFNADESAAYDFLAKSGRQGRSRVPYRANRAVIFDSNLFHKTDTIPLRTVMRTGGSTSPCCMGAGGGAEWRRAYTVPGHEKSKIAKPWGYFRSGTKGVL